MARQAFLLPKRFGFAFRDVEQRATEAGVAVYIDRQLAGPYGRDKYRYTKGPFVESVPEHGYHVAEEGSVEPATAANALLAGAVALGAEIFTHSHVKWLIEDGPGWTAVDSGFSLAETKEAWERIFAEQGYGLITATTGQQGIDLFAQQHPDVLVLDHSLPDMTGLDVLRQVRQRSKLPVIFCTARDGQEDVVTALREGADDYLRKPIRRLELLARVESVTRRALKVHAKVEAFEVDCFRVDGVSRTIVRPKVEDRKNVLMRERRDRLGFALESR
jgi:CheY-like chemotaxis protein